MAVGLLLQYHAIGEIRGSVTFAVTEILPKSMADKEMMSFDGLCIGVIVIL